MSEIKKFIEFMEKCPVISENATFLAGLSESLSRRNISAPETGSLL